MHKRNHVSSVLHTLAKIQNPSMIPGHHTVGTNNYCIFLSTGTDSRLKRRNACELY